MTGLADRKRAVKLIEEAVRNGARLRKACGILKINIRTYERWTEKGTIEGDLRPDATRPEPKNKLTEEEERLILEIVNTKEYSDLPPAQIVPKLADEAVYVASESTIRRVLNKNKQAAHRGKSKPAKTKAPETYVAKAPNRVWTWDITWLVDRKVTGMYFKLYLILDIFTRKIVGHEVWKEENAEHSEALIKRTMLAENIGGKPLVLHSDNGKPLKASTLKVTLEKLGVISSFSRPRVSNDNPYSESLFKTVKGRPGYPEKGFASLEEARAWVAEFVRWYNDEHMHSGIRYLTPNMRHEGREEEVLSKRRATYERAKALHPERWSGDIRDWSLDKEVALNPSKDERARVKATNDNERSDTLNTTVDANEGFGFESLPSEIGKKKKKKKNRKKEEQKEKSGDALPPPAEPCFAVKGVVCKP